MEYHIFVLRILFIIFCYHSILLNVKALIGHEVRPVEPNEFPSVVCIARYNPDQLLVDRIICSGTIVSPSFIMTTESCFIGAAHNPIEILTSCEDINLSAVFYPTWWVAYNHWAVANNIPIDSPYNDILLARLQGPLPNFEPMPISTIYPISQLYNLHGDLVGCGRINSGAIPTVPHTTTIQVISFNMCADAWSELQGEPIELDPDKLICTIGIPFRFLEFGDTGGPVLYFGTIIAINLGVRPLNGIFNPGKINLALNLHTFNDFLIEFLTSP